MKPWITIANTWAMTKTSATVPINRLVLMPDLLENADRQRLDVPTHRGQPSKVNGTNRYGWSRSLHPDSRGASVRLAVHVRALPFDRHHRRVRIDITGPDFPRPVVGQRLRSSRQDIQDLIGFQCPARRLLHQRDDAGDMRRRHRCARRARIVRLIEKVDVADPRIVLEVAALE